MAHSADSPNVAEPVEGQQIGFYRLERRLGRGGMGLVFRAVDTRLGRAVALKFLSPALCGDAPARARFVREARAASALEHPNVIAIYEVGEEDGVPFIAMALHDGESLKQRLARGPLPPAEAARLLAQLAGALACAHASRIAHRDVKPGNIMLAPDGQVKLVDFGLAKVLDDTADLTRTGELLGTLDYIAPEQHQKGEAGLAADLWSLGVVGYELVAGRPPFHRATTASLVTAVLHEEPAPLARAGLAPIELETIIFKCLEKDPARRYASAQALADDLARLLAGEPISTRRVGLSRRLGRRAARNRLALIAATIAAAGMLALGVGLYEVRHGAAERTRRAGALGQRVQQIRTAMRSAHLMPLHDTKVERERVRAQLREIEADERALGKEGRGPGEFALGVGYLSLGEDAAAREHLEAAWAAGERGPDLAYALGLVLGRAWQREMQGAPPLDEEGRKKWTRDLETRLRDPALAYLRAADGAADTSPAYVAALLAFYERRYDDALKNAEAAFQSAPSLYEASMLEARVYAEQARMKSRAGDVEGGRALFARADAACRRAQESGRSDDTVYAFYSDFLIEQGFILDSRHEDPTATFSAALEVCDRGARSNSDAPWPDALRATAYWLMGEADFARHRDPRPRYEQSVAAAERSVARSPDAWQAYNAMGNAYGLIAERCESSRGRDPRPWLKKAVAAFEAALRITSDEEAWQDLGVTHSSIARWQIAHGEEGQPEVEAAVAAYESAIHTERIEANSSYAHSNACSLLAELAGDRVEHGKDPRAILERADRHCAAALAADKTRAAPLVGQGEVAYWRALQASRTGGEALPFLERSEAALAAGVALDGSRGDAHGDLARDLVLRVELAIAAGGDARAAAERAVAEARAAVRLDGESGGSHLRLAQALLAVAHARAGRDPLAEAATEIARALAINAGDAESLITAAEIALASARRHGPAALADGERRIDAALAANPTSARALAIRAALARAAGDSARADAALAAALRLNPTLRGPF